MGDILNRFNLSKEAYISDPDYDKPYGSKLPPLTGYGNLSYPQFIEVIQNLWSRAHSEVAVVPYGNKAKYDPEKGYILYSLENKKPADNNPKPTHRHDIVHFDTGSFEASVFSQSFNYLVQFTAVHRDPVVAERILEAFEDFMMVTAPEIMQAGVSQLFYNRRVSDRDMTRLEEDLAGRAVIYMVTLQKIIVIKPGTLDSIRVDIRTFMSQGEPDLNDILAFDLPSPEEGHYPDDPEV